MELTIVLLLLDFSVLVLLVSVLLLLLLPILEFKVGIPFDFVAISTVTKPATPQSKQQQIYFLGLPCCRDNAGLIDAVEELEEEDVIVVIQGILRKGCR
jgi:hypothetical protein